MTSAQAPGRSFTGSYCMKNREKELNKEGESDHNMEGIKKK